MELYSYKFTDLFAFNSPSMSMWLAPSEVVEFATIIAQDMFYAHPDISGSGMCVAVSNLEGALVSVVPVGTAH
jgi:hypothetical protein